jgi:hypothetical protein
MRTKISKRDRSRFQRPSSDQSAVNRCLPPTTATAGTAQYSIFEQGKKPSCWSGAMGLPTESPRHLSAQIHQVHWGRTVSLQPHLQRASSTFISDSLYLYSFGWSSAVRFKIKTPGYVDAGPAQLLLLSNCIKTFSRSSIPPGFRPSPLQSSPLVDFEKQERLLLNVNVVTPKHGWNSSPDDIQT